VHAQLVAHPKHRRSGRPRQDATLDHEVWQIQAAVTINAASLEREVRRKAAFLVATNVLDPDQLSDQELIQTYKEQHSVERGFSFLKDPLFWPRRSS
jgi:transposase